MGKKLLATGVNWLINRPDSSFRSKVKIRYNSRGTDAAVYPQGENVTVEFDEQVSAITPGQLAAFYIEDKSSNRLIGGGWINEAFIV
jgi:tRNA-specific 2-thiouridylase